MSYEDVEAMHVDIGPDNDHSSSRAATFWRETERYHDLAQMFEENIEYDRRAYDYVTSRRMCPCLEYCNRCSFPLEGKVVRIDYRGPNI
jgi:hypothetical protein